MKMLSLSLVLLPLCLPDRVEAQNTTGSSGEVHFFTGQVYQGGSRKKGLKQTTSVVSLPNLNQILAPTPLPQNQGTVPRSPSAVPTRYNQPRTQSSSKFGYGSSETSSVPSGPVGFDEDPLQPVDPGYEPQPRPVPGSHWQPIQPDPQPTTQINIRDSVIHLNAGTPQTLPALSGAPYPFAHQYYPRSYYYQMPYAYSVYPSSVGYRPSHSYYGCNVASGLRGYYTSSRNYLSGFGYNSRPRFSLGIRF